MFVNLQGAARIAIVDSTKCKPSKCNLECKKFCPVERTGKECVTVTKQDATSRISEVTCIGCGICVKKCPMNAITIINLPRPIDGEITHRYSPNSFMLHRLPRPRRGQVLGIVGSNGTGKSTALKILSGKMVPNFGNFDNPTPLTWEEVVTHFRGSELQNYFRLMSSPDLKVSVKPQNIAVNSDILVRDALAAVDERGVMDQLVADLDLGAMLDRGLDCLGGGEVQRFSIAYACAKKASIYLFDEPSNYLDIRQRVKAARVIRSILTDSNYVTVVEHDLMLLDFLSDVVCILYGMPGAYGVATLPYSVREGINVFLDGYLPAENMRIRPEALDFNVRTNTEPEKAKRVTSFYYNATELRNGNNPNSQFRLTVEAGDFNSSEIIVLLGQNGCGKTTFIRHLVQVANNELPADENSLENFAAENSNRENRKFPASRLSVSYKPQQISPKFPGTVRQLLEQRVAGALCDPLYVSDVLKSLGTERLMDLKVLELSGGELQKVALCLALGKPADVYLLDEPSSFLDSEQRLIAAKVIKRFIMHKKKTAFVVEHDFIMATYLADRVIVYDGVAGVECVARSPQALVTGMNAFLRGIDVTLRRDPVNWRPRINKPLCVRDREQKLAGTFYYVGDESDY